MEKWILISCSVTCHVQWFYVQYFSIFRFSSFSRSNFSRWIQKPTCYTYLNDNTTISCLQTRAAFVPLRHWWHLYMYIRQKYCALCDMQTSLYNEGRSKGGRGSSLGCGVGGRGFDRVPPTPHMWLNTGMWPRWLASFLFPPHTVLPLFLGMVSTHVLPYSLYMSCCVHLSSVHMSCCVNLSSVHMSWCRHVSSVRMSYCT
jgi:hypothetical protein